MLKHKYTPLKVLIMIPAIKNTFYFLHAFRGCDTTSAPFKKGKKTFVKTLQNHPDLDQLAQVFQQENYPVQILFENGVRILLAI